MRSGERSWRRTAAVVAVVAAVAVVIVIVVVAGRVDFALKKHFDYAADMHVSSWVQAIAVE